MNLRDQCEHGLYDEHRFHVDHELRVGPVISDKYRPCDPEDCDSSWAWEDCPGGAAVTPDRRAALCSVEAEMQDRRIDRYITDEDVWNEAVAAIAAVAVDAALDIGESS